MTDINQQPVMPDASQQQQADPAVSGGLVATAQNPNSPQPNQQPVPPTQQQATAGSPNPTAPNFPPVNTDATKGQPHPMSRIYDGILKGLTGGDIYYTAPDGSRQLAPQSRSTMGKSIVAAALAGLFSKNEYTPTPYGNVRDWNATAGNAYSAGQAKIDAMRNAPQKVSDEQQTHALFTLQSNATLMKTLSAASLDQGKSFDALIEAGKPQLADIDYYETNRTSDQAPARVGQHMSVEDAKAKVKESAFSRWVGVPDGMESRFNPQTGKTERHMTFSVIDPNVKVTMSPETAAVLALTNKQYENMPPDNKVSLGIAVAAQHEVSTIHVAQSFADAANDALGLPHVNLMSKIKADRTLLPAIDAARDQMAAGGSTWRTLDAARTSKNGVALLDAMGIKPDVAETYIHDSMEKDIADDAKAKLAIKPVTTANASVIANDPEETPQRKALAATVITVEDKRKADLKERELITDQTVKQGSPEDAGPLMYDGTLTLSELKARSATPNFIVKTTEAAKAEASKNGDPDWTPQVAEAQLSAAKSSANVAFFGSGNSLISKGGTLDQLIAQHKRLGNGPIPKLNSWEDYQKFQTGDPALAGFMQTALGAADDYAKVMGGGAGGSDESRRQLKESFMNSLSDPQMESAVNAARDAVGSQVDSRIGHNKVMRKMYGYALPQDTLPPLSVFKGRYFNMDGKSWENQNGKVVRVR